MELTPLNVTVGFVILIIIYYFIKLVLRTYFRLKKQYTFELTKEVKGLYNGTKR